MNVYVFQDFKISVLRIFSKANSPSPMVRQASVYRIWTSCLEVEGILPIKKFKKTDMMSTDIGAMSIRPKYTSYSLGYDSFKGFIFTPTFEGGLKHSRQSHDG